MTQGGSVDHGNGGLVEFGGRVRFEGRRRQRGREWQRRSSSSKVWWALTKLGGLTGWWSAKLETTPAVVGAKLHWTFGGTSIPSCEMGPWTG